MTATSEFLLITQPDSARAKVSPLYFKTERGAVFPFLSVRKGTLIGALVVDQDCMIWEISSYRIRGLAKPSESAFPFTTYVFIVLVQSLLLNPPVLVEMTLMPKEKSDLPTLKKRVNELIDRNPDVYTHETGTRLRRLVATCRSVGCIGEAIMGNPRPNE